MAKTPFNNAVIPKFVSIAGDNKVGWERKRPIWHGDKHREQNAGNEKGGEGVAGERSRKRARVGSTATPVSASAPSPSPAPVASAPVNNAPPVSTAPVLTTVAGVGPVVQPQQMQDVQRQEGSEDESDSDL